MTKNIYMDSGATTKVFPEVIETITKEFQNYGNPSSRHTAGAKAKETLDNSRNIIANKLNAKPEEIIFTASGTEGNNTAIKGIAFANKNKGNHIITTKIEHDCILNATKWLTKQGFVVDYLDVDENGFINPNQLKELIKPETILVSVIHANNEIGTIQDLKPIYEICKNNNTYFHTDACQSFTKTEINSEMADLITLNAHKIHGPKGVGALFVKKGTKITPLLHGGGQESHIRSGTENIPLIAGFAKAVELSKNINYNEIEKLKDYFIEELLKIKGTKLNGPKENRLPNNINISFQAIEGESIVELLNVYGIAASTGSACSSNSLDPSHVIMAISNDVERAHSSIRFTLSEDITKEDIDYTLTKIKETVEKLRSFSPLEVK